MLSIGSIIFSSSKGEVISKVKVRELRDTFIFDELFNLAWTRLINPWLQSAYATLNLRTGELEGNDEYTMSRGTPYLILFKVKLASLAPEDILTTEEMEKYEESVQLLEQFCEKYGINVKQRAKDYYQSNWSIISWYFDSVIEENMFDFYENREVTLHEIDSAVVEG